MKLKTASVFAVIYYLVSFAFFRSVPDKNFYIKFIDVGQGDAIFIRSPENNTMLIDGGGNFQVDQALNREMPFPLCHLDYLVITHPHVDHIKGLEKIMKRCSIGIVMFNDVSRGEVLPNVFEHLLKKNKVINTFAGDEFFFGKAKIKILWPVPELIKSNVKNLNDVSIALFLDHKDFEVLFLGDLEENYQPYLDLSGIKNLINGRLEVVKISHHGSVNGVFMPLIRELKPEKCVVSVGKDNTFGHPNKEALESLVSGGCEVLRTDFLGDIVITTN